MLGEGIKVTALHTPCHTQDSICYLLEDEAKGERAVFTGDTLFVGACGRFFEGEPKEMDTALNEVLAGLPDDTMVYVRDASLPSPLYQANTTTPQPGHEYTAQNAKFASATLPSDPAVKKLHDHATNTPRTEGKTTIGDEKGWNVFMRLGVCFLCLSFLPSLTVCSLS